MKHNTRCDYHRTAAWRTLLSRSARDIVTKYVVDARMTHKKAQTTMRISSLHVSMDDGTAIFIAGEELHEA